MIGPLGPQQAVLALCTGAGTLTEDHIDGRHGALRQPVGRPGTPFGENRPPWSGKMPRYASERLYPGCVETGPPRAFDAAPHHVG
jgi:hypothetical protein